MQQRVIIITGASSGIGRALARRLAGSARLVLVARRAERLEKLVDEIGAEGGEAVAVAVDLTADHAAATVVERCLAAFGEITAVVNNAGIYQTALTADIDREHIRQHFCLNVEVPMLLTAQALPHLMEGGGMVVNVSSVASQAGFPANGVYGATKAALEAWASSLRAEMRGQGVRVADVLPGGTDTEIWDANCPFDRHKMIRADDVARAIQVVLDTPPSANIDRLVVTPPCGSLD